MAEFGLVMAVAVVVTTIMEYVKKAFPALEDKTGIIFIVTAALGVLTAIGFGADIFAQLGYTSTIPFLGCILTGILCAGGSNLIYDVINAIKGAGNTEG